MQYSNTVKPTILAALIFTGLSSRLFLVPLILAFLLAELTNNLK